jgi:hypothetical protein
LSWGDVALHRVKMRQLRAAQCSSREAAPPAEQSVAAHGVANY